jgi:5-methylcytosine-specific restriction endonuclease McrA
MKFRRWREAVFKRDDYTCQFCKERGGELHPDHIKPFALFPRLRFDINNGRTLCVACHRKTPTWGMNKKYQKNSSKSCWTT